MAEIDSSRSPLLPSSIDEDESFIDDLIQFEASIDDEFVLDCYDDDYLVDLSLRSAHRIDKEEKRKKMKKVKKENEVHGMHGWFMFCDFKSCLEICRFE